MSLTRRGVPTQHKAARPESKVKPRKKAFAPAFSAGIPRPPITTNEEYEAACAEERAGTPRPLFTRADEEIVARAVSKGVRRLSPRPASGTGVSLATYGRRGSLSWRAGFFRVSAEVWGCRVQVAVADPSCWALRVAGSHRSASLEELAARVASEWGMEPRDDRICVEVEFPSLAALGGARRDGRVVVDGELDEASPASPAGAGRAALDQLVNARGGVRARPRRGAREVRGAWRHALGRRGCARRGRRGPHARLAPRAERRQAGRAPGPLRRADQGARLAISSPSVVDRISRAPFQPRSSA